MTVFKNIRIRIYLLAMVALFCASCITPFDAETQNFESALVIDALLTDEMKQHTVKLSRTFRFEENEPIAERNAKVEIRSENGTSYPFSESNPGHYISQTAFSAVSGMNYILKIETVDGRTYESKSVLTPEKTPIADFYAERQTNDLGVEGVSIRLDNETNTSEPTYFRYEYEETYKIVAPDTQRRGSENLLCQCQIIRYYAGFYH